MSKEMVKRKNIRLDGYDYSKAGCYFITICVKDRHEMLGDIVGARIARPQLSEIGEVVEGAITNIPIIYSNVTVDNYIIMPNHVHMIIRIDDNIDGNSGRAMRAPTISTVVNQMKGYVTKQIGFSIWQKLFHDNIIRNKNEHQKISDYIEQNPLSWLDDCYHPKQVPQKNNH